MNEPDVFQKISTPVRAMQFMGWDFDEGGNWSALRAFARDGDEDRILYEQGPGARGCIVYDRLHRSWIPFARGDWIVKGIEGEFYPLKKAQFSRTLEHPPNRLVALRHIEDRERAQQT